MDLTCKIYLPEWMIQITLNSWKEFTKHNEVEHFASVGTIQVQ
jgi:hypothetical protein